MAEATNFAPTENNGQTGVRAEYFDNPNLQGAPTLVRTEQHINYGRDARASYPAPPLSARWAGYYTPQTAGVFDIFAALTGEDGGRFRLYVDDKLRFPQS